MSSVDVVIPCYKYAHFLTQSVESVLSQRDVDVRVLIVDDASPDNTPEIGQALAEREGRVTYIRNETNLGLIGTANKGLLEWAEADYCILLSADDAVSPGAFARAAAVMDAHPKVHLAFGRAALFAEDSNLPVVADIPTPTCGLVGGDAFVRRNFERGNPAPSPSVLVRTAVQKRLGGYLPQLKHTSDMEMWMRFACNGPIAAIREVQGYYRLHDGNMSTAYNEQALRDRQEIIDTCSIIVDAYGASMPEARHWLVDLKRRFADEAFWLAGRALAENDMEAMEARLRFAEAHHPSPGMSSAAWKFRVKQMLGAELTRGLMRREQPMVSRNDDASAYEARTGEVGWWPGGE